MKYEAEAKALLEDASVSGVAAYLEAFAKERDAAYQALEKRFFESNKAIAALEAEIGFKGSPPGEGSWIQRLQASESRLKVAESELANTEAHRKLYKDHAEQFSARLKAVEAERDEAMRSEERTNEEHQDTLRQHEKLVQRASSLVALLDKNTESYPCDVDDGTCYYCGNGMGHPDGWEDECDHLDSPEGHKPECSWRQAREALALTAPSSKPCEEKPDPSVDAAWKKMVEKQHDDGCQSEKPIHEDGPCDCSLSAKENGK